MPWPAIAMLALTGAKMVSDADKAERDRKLAAKTQLYSPWTNLKANEVEEADPAGTAAQGLAGYMGYEQAQENAALRKNLVDAQIGALNRSNGGSVGAAAGGRMGGDLGASIVEPGGGESPAYRTRGYDTDTQADYWGRVMNADPNAYVQEAVNNGQNPYFNLRRRRR